VSFVNPSVRMLRAVRVVRDTHSNCQSAKCETVNLLVRMLSAVRMIRGTHPNGENVECELHCMYSKHECENVEGNESG